MYTEDENSIPPLSAGLLIHLIEEKPHQIILF